ncbi:MAG TPA: hypothetical protein VJ739_07710, partial [Gemmataceae bacterium]|nr:hypothetical protein [Gemmataceae bacterium]
MSDDSDSPPEPTPRKRRRWGCLALGLLVPAVLLVGGYVFLRVRANQELREAVAEADRLDPGWRLEDVEAARLQLPDQENSALQVTAVAALVPPGWAGSTAFSDLFVNLPPERQLNEAQVKALRAELQKVAPALQKARRLADMPRGHYLIHWSPDFITTPIPDVLRARKVAYLLEQESLLRAQEKGSDSALRSVRAGVNVARSLDDTPLLMGQLVRIACRSVALVSLERVLAQGEPSPADLAELQHALEEEERQPDLLTGLRGERAGKDMLLRNVESGQVPLSLLLKLSGPGGALRPEVTPLLAAGGIPRQHAALLRALTEMTEAAKQPMPGPVQEFQELESAKRDGPLLVRVLAPAMMKMGRASQHGLARTRCAIILLAAERYRRERGRWPTSLPALVQAGYLREVPADPYDGQPLRLRRRADGLVVYAVGP